MPSQIHASASLAGAYGWPILLKLPSTTFYAMLQKLENTQDADEMTGAMAWSEAVVCAHLSIAVTHELHLTDFMDHHGAEDPARAIRSVVHAVARLLRTVDAQTGADAVVAHTVRGGIVPDTCAALSLSPSGPPRV